MIRARTRMATQTSGGAWEVALGPCETFDEADLLSMLRGAHFLRKADVEAHGARSAVATNPDVRVGSYDRRERLKALEVLRDNTVSLLA